MSPNTCSIETPPQDVVVAGDVKVSVVIIAPPDDPVMEKESEEVAVKALTVTQLKKEIRIILPKDDETDDDGARRNSVSSAWSEGSRNGEDKSEENSDSSSDIISCGSVELNEKEQAHKIVTQVESMFSDEHLAKDGFLLKHVRRRPDGWVSLKLVAGLRKVRQISREFSVIRKALRGSTKLELNAEGNKVRRMEPLTDYLKSMKLKEKKENEEMQQPTNNSIQNTQEWNLSPSQNRRNNQKRKNTKTSSNGNRNGSNKPVAIHPADLFRNVYLAGEDSQFSGRKRGGSLPSQRPIAVSSEAIPNGSFLTVCQNGERQKSNSYCEGTPSTMSPWLQRRKALIASSNNDLSFAGSVIRQPRGPDGTKGFASGYRAMILQERLQQQKNSAVSP